MIIKEGDLQELREAIQYRDGNGISLNRLKRDIASCAENMGIPVTFEIGQVKVGGFLKSELEDCLVFYHPDHEKDYYKVCIRLMWIGRSCKISFYSFGESKQMKKMYLYNQAVQGGIDNGGGQLASRIMGSLLVPGINKRKAEEEQMYYDLILELIDNVFVTQ